jgi:EpsI family protein
MSAPVQRTRRALVLALCLVGSAAAARYLTPRDRSKEPLNLSLERMIPASFGDWAVDKTIVPVNMAADAENALYAVYDAVLARTYINRDGQRVMLSVGYSRQQGGVQKPHWQEICYRAQGFAVTGIVRQQAVLSGRKIPVTRMLARQGSRSEPVTYWLTLGDHVVQDRWDRLSKLLRMGLQGESTDGFLMRVSSLSADAPAAYALQMSFSEAMLQAVGPEQRRQLVGRE